MIDHDPIAPVVQKAHEWIVEIRDILDLKDRQRVYHVMRAGFHALRDRLPVYEVVHLGAQLPWVAGAAPSTVDVAFARHPLLRPQPTQLLRVSRGLDAPAQCLVRA